MPQPRTFTATPFRPRRGARSPHVQTIWGNFMRRENLLPPPEFRRFTVEGTPGSADFAEVLCACHWQPTPDFRCAPTVIIVHGLEGSIESNYVIGAGSKAWAAGMNVVRMNMRNCGGTESLTPTLYHSGLSADLAAIVRTLTAQDQLRTIALVGFSMGGNLVLKCAGEWGSNNAPPPVQLSCVVAVSPAMDLAPSARAISSRGNRLYEIRFMRGLRRRYQRKRELFPDRYDDITIPWNATIWQFDDLITARYNGFTDAADYYERSSASRLLHHIPVPALIIHALDDPFIRIPEQSRARALANPHITYLETAHGGHCAFLADPDPASRYDGRWAEKTAIDFIASHGSRREITVGPHIR